MDSNEYIFWIIPNLAEKPRSYLIYRANDRSKPVAYVVFENKEYQVSGETDLTFTEQLKILEACDIFLKQRYFSESDT